MPPGGGNMCWIHVQYAVQYTVQCTVLLPLTWVVSEGRTIAIC